jgi:hypothetical protein
MTDREAMISLLGWMQGRRASLSAPMRRAMDVAIKALEERLSGQE